MMVWTRFMDMHSGGGQKEDFSKLYIEAPEDEAKVIFYNRFGHNPERVTCTCCGDDYSIDESDTLEEASAHDRGCSWSEDERRYVEGQDPNDWRAKYETYVPLAEYIKRREDVNAGLSQIVDGKTVKPKVAFIFAKDIKQEERVGSIPEQGYVWVD